MAIVIRRTFIDVDVEKEEGREGQLHRSCSDGAIMDMARAATWRMMVESAQLDDDLDLLDAEAPPARAVTEDPKQRVVIGKADVSRQLSSWSAISTSGSLTPSRSVSWADADPDDMSAGSWATPASEEGDPETSPAAEAKSVSARCGRGKRGGAAGRRQRAARECHSPEPVALRVRPEAERQTEDGERNTLVLQNLEGGVLRSEVQAILDDAGFAGAYDFLYVPIDFNAKANLGHAIINFATTDAAAAFQKAFEGRVEVSTPVAGLNNLMQRYRNSPVMHPAVPDEYRPVVLRAGRRVDFLAPTCEVRLLRAFS